MTLEVITAIPARPLAMPPLLFIHGAWHAAWCWRDFLGFFSARGYSCHALSFRGHGASSNPRSLRFASIGDYVRDVASVAETLPQPPILIAHSMGSFVAHHYLVKNEASGAVFVAPLPPRGGAWGATFKGARRHPLAFARVNLGMWLYPMVDTVERASDLLFSDEMPREKAAEIQGRLQDESYRAYLGMLLTPVLRRSARRCPALVLAAEDDALVDASDIAATARFYECNTVTVPAMGHDMMLEPRWSEVAEHIDVWLRGADFAASRV